MADYYYEISDAVKESWDNKYYVAHVRGGHDAMMAGGFAVTMNSDRIWRQDSDGSIRFIKHRWKNPHLAQVDLKEFMWIKLKAQDIKGA